MYSGMGVEERVGVAPPVTERLCRAVGGGGRFVRERIVVDFDFLCVSIRINDLGTLPPMQRGCDRGGCHLRDIERWRHLP